MGSFPTLGFRVSSIQQARRGMRRLQLLSVRDPEINHDYLAHFKRWILVAYMPPLASTRRSLMKMVSPPFILTGNRAEAWHTPRSSRYSAVSSIPVEKT